MKPVNLQLDSQSIGLSASHSVDQSVGLLAGLSFRWSVSRSVVWPVIRWFVGLSIDLSVGRLVVSLLASQSMVCWMVNRRFVGRSVDLSVGRLVVSLLAGESFVC
jgi:hypothetical protein